MTEREKLELSISTLEEQRHLLGDAAVEVVLTGLRQQLAKLMETESTTPLQPVLVIKDERKLITVVFADISGFTALSERLDPEQVRDIVNACFNSLVPIIEKFGGFVDKFVGDMIMVLFGAPVAHEDHAERAQRAALEMMEALSAFNTRYKTDLGMHIGINSGLVVAGGLGSEGQQHYSVMGDTVNLASRLEDASVSGQILVGHNTYQLTSSLFDFETLPPLLIKGKTDPVVAYRLIGLKSLVKRENTGLSDLVGRDTELVHLRTSVRNLVSGKGALIAVTGEPGIGKSRLMTELRRLAEMDIPGIKWAEGHTQSYTEGISYWVVKNMMDSLFGISPEMSPAEVSTAFWRLLLSLCGGQTNKIFPYLARLREIPLSAEMEEQIKHVLPAALQDRMLRSFVDLVRAMSRERPMVMVWEDLQWADPSSISLLETLLPLTDEVPVILFLLFRENEGLAEEWHNRIRKVRGDDKYQVIKLTPLLPDHSNQMIENLLGNVPAEIRQLILNRAEGNPFFLEELCNSLVESGYLAHEGDTAVRTSPTGNLDIPDTLHGVIAARIDRLSAEGKHTLQTASVIGRVFRQNILGKLLEYDNSEINLDSTLADLQKKELIRLHDVSEYIFKHAVMHEVTYNSLLIARRKDLHRMAAQVIETSYAGQLEELSATLAYQYEKADVYEKAIYYLTKAADRARKSYSNTESIAFYQAALEHVRRFQHAEMQTDFMNEQTVHIFEGLGEVFTLTGYYDKAREAYQNALAHVPDDDRVRQSQLHRNIGKTWIAQRLPQKSLDDFNRASEALGIVSRESGHKILEESLEIALDLLVAHYFCQSPYSLMRELADSIDHTIVQKGTPAQRGKYFSSLLLMTISRERYLITDECMEYAQSAMIASQEADDKQSITLTTFQLGFCLLWRGDFKQAEAVFQEALTVAEQIGDQGILITILSYITVNYHRSDQREKVRYFAARCLEIATPGNIVVYIGIAKANQGWLKWRDGNLAEAQEDLRAALGYFKSKQIPFYGLWLASMPLIDISLTNGNVPEAIQLCRDILLPTQMHIDKALEEILGHAIAAWDLNEDAKALDLLERGIVLAKQTSWI